jgi:hypothetical protein
MVGIDSCGAITLGSNSAAFPSPFNSETSFPVEVFSTRFDATVGSITGIGVEAGAGSSSITGAGEEAGLVPHRSQGSV